MALFGGIQLPGKPDPANIQKLDLLPLPQISRMMRVGIAIDKEHLWDLSLMLEKRKTSLGQGIQSFVPQAALDEFVSDSPEDSLNVESAEQISNLLFQTLRIGSSEKLKMTKSGKRISSGKKQLESLKRRHPVIPLILEYREASKLNSMIATIIGAASLEKSTDSWVIRGEIVSTRTATGRLAMRRPNLMQIPARSDLGRELRAGFVPRPGKVFIACDLSQIELRLIAHSANEPNMLRIFHSGGDIHLDTAMRAFDISDPAKVDKLLHRAPAKTVAFGCAYGLGPPGLLDTMAVVYGSAGLALPDWLTLEWCTQFIEKWFGLYPKAREYFELQHRRARRYGIVWDMLGRVRRIPEVRSYHTRIHQAGLRQAGNAPIQCIMGNMKVFCKDAGLVEIGELEGREATLWDGSQWSSGHVVPAGLKDVYRMSTADGGILETSGDHGILIRTPKIERWMSAEELRSKKESSTRAGWMNYRAALCGPADNDWSNSMVLPDSWDPLWFGRLASDGNAVIRTGGGSYFVLRVAEHEEDILPYLWARSREVCSSATLRSERKTDKNQIIFSIVGYSLSTARKLVAVGEKGRIPVELYGSSASLCQYLRGLFDGDGGVTGGETITLTFGGGDRRLAWAHEIRNALLILGIRSRVHYYPNGRAVRVLIMKSDAPVFNSLIGFMSAEKIAKATMIGPSANGSAAYGRAVGIDSIERIGRQAKMYDFVNSTTGRFGAEGFVVHNSGACGVFKLGMARVERLLSAWRDAGVYVEALLPVHDELLIECDPAWAEDIKDLVIMEMEKALVDTTGVLQCRCPILAEGKVMPRWLKG